MPHLIGHDLSVRILHDVADPGRLRPLIRFLKGFAMKQYFPFSFSMRRQNRLAVSQKSRFAAAAFAAQQNIFPVLYRQIDILQSLRRIKISRYAGVLPTAFGCSARCSRIRKT